MIFFCNIPSNKSKINNELGIYKERRYFCKLCSSATLALFSSGCSDTSTSLTTETPDTPIIITQPTNQQVKLGEVAVFYVDVSTSSSISYQWKRNDVDIQGATESTYTTQALTHADNNSQFSVIIKNQTTSLTSTTALLQVLTPELTSDSTEITIDSTFYTID